MPCEGGEAVKPANEMRLNNISAAVSTPQLKILCVVDKTPKDVTITAAWADFMRLRTLRTAQKRRESSRQPNAYCPAMNPPAFGRCNFECLSRAFFARPMGCQWRALGKSAYQCVLAASIRKSAGIARHFTAGRVLIAERY